MSPLCTGDPFTAGLGEIEGVEKARAAPKGAPPCDLESHEIYSAVG